MADEYIATPADVFPMGKLVKARVLSVSQTEDIAKLSLKPSVVGDDKLKLQLQKLIVGSVVVGKVHKVTDFGVFVRLDGTDLIGLSRRECAASMKVNDLKEVYTVGDLVRAKILGINGHKISLGLRPSYFEGEVDERTEEDEEVEEGIDVGADDYDGRALGNEEEEILETEDTSGDDDDEEEGEGAVEDEDFGEDEGNDYLVENEEGIIMPLEDEDDEDDDELKELIAQATLREADDELESEDMDPDNIPEPPQKKTKVASKKSKEKLEKQVSDKYVVAEDDAEDEDEEVGGRKVAVLSGQPSFGAPLIAWDDFKPAQVCYKPQRCLV